MFSKKANNIWAFHCYNHIAHPMLLLYAVCEYNSKVLTALRTKFETFAFLLTLSSVSCCQLKICLWNLVFMSWPWDTRSYDRSIVPELLSLPISAVEKQSQRKELKLHGVMDQSFQERRSLWTCEDHRKDLCDPFPLFLPRNLGVKILVRWVEP
jgi:hypothetical protein